MLLKPGYLITDCYYYAKKSNLPISLLKDRNAFISFGIEKSNVKLPMKLLEKTVPM
jgi:hypothetical protein